MLVPTISVALATPSPDQSEDLRTSFGSTAYEVRSVQQLDITALNDRIEAAAARQESWTTEAILVALHFAGPGLQSMQKSVVVDCSGERYESDDPGTVVVTITESGVLDDAIGGERYRFWLTCDCEGTWRISAALWAQLCRRMHQIYYSAESCP